MKQSRQYLIDLWLFIVSVVVFLYLMFMNYAFVNKWYTFALGVVTELITIPILLAGCIIPIVVVFRLLTKRTQNRSFATLSMFFLLLSIVSIIYMTLLRSI